MMNLPRTAAWRRTVLQWIGGRETRRDAGGRSRAPTRLGVESLEQRTLLSATSPYGDEPLDFPAFADDALGAYAPPRYDDGPLAGAGNDDAVGYVHEELPPSLDFSPEDRHAAWSPPPGAPLRAQYAASQIVYVVRMVRVMPQSPLRLTAPTGGVGSSLSGGFSENPGGSGASRSSPIAAKAPPSSETSSADAPLNVIASPVSSQSTNWLPALTSPSQTASQSESPLLRALESRDAVFRALATSTGKRAGEILQSLGRNGEQGDQPQEVDATESETDDSVRDDELAWDDSLDAGTLRDATEQQAADVAAILAQLAVNHAEHRSQAERDAIAELVPPTEPAAPPTDATPGIVDQGGMILLRALAGDAALAAGADQGIAIGELPHPNPAVAMQAEIGLYKAFGVAAGEAVDDVPTAAALPVKTAPSQGGANEQNARESAAAPTASASPEAVVTASVVSLTVAASGLRTRPYPQIRRERH